MKISISLNSTAKEISDIISKASENTEIVLEKGTYFLDEPVNISNKHNIIFNGNDSIVMPQFFADKYYGDSTDAFHVTACTNITFKNFKISASQRTNSAGEILKSTPEYIDVKFNSDMTGKEICLGGMTYYENWVSDFIPLYHWCKNEKPDKNRYVTIAEAFRTSAPEKLDTEHEVIAENTFRICTTQNNELLKKGMKCSVYHAYYGLCAFVFKNTSGVLIENVHISNFGGMGFVILPRCSDFTFSNVRIASDDMEHQPYSTCSDGIHTTGIGGKLILDNCYFELLGDDCLNLHTNALTVKKCSENKIEVFLDKPNSIMPENWAQADDVLRIYDGKTLSYKGTINVTSYSDGNVIYENEDCEISEGDFVSNSFYYPHLIIKNCKICHTRGRMVIQSADKCEIFDNTFENTNRCVYLSTAFRFWGEVGPVKNAEIYNNKFIAGTGDTVYVRVNDENSDNIFHMHENISIHDNVFENIPDKAVNAWSTDRLTVENNVFIKCSKNPIGIRNCL